MSGLLSAMLARLDLIELSRLVGAVKDLLRKSDAHNDSIILLTQRVIAMDAAVQAAFDRANVQLDGVATTLNAEIDEVKALISTLPGTDPTELVTAVDGITARLANLQSNIAAVSDQVFPPAA